MLCLGKDLTRVARVFIINVRLLKNVLVVNVNINLAKVQVHRGTRHKFLFRKTIRVIYYCIVKKKKDNSKISKNKLYAWECGVYV